jgi:hypothetical protein
MPTAKPLQPQRNASPHQFATKTHSPSTAIHLIARHLEKIKISFSLNLA